MITNINSEPFFYVDEGNSSGTPVIFLHGFPFSHQMWKGQIEAVKKNFRAIAYDLRGHGKSALGNGQFTIEQHVDDLFALMDFWKAERAVIVGLSMGGYIALRALERDPSRFKAAVLCDTKSEADTDEAKLKRFEGMKSVRKNGSEAFAETFTKNVFTPESFQKNADAVVFIKGIIQQTTPLSIAGSLLALAARTNTTASLTRIKIPTLILVGEKDAVTTPANARTMHEKIAGSELHIIPNAAHMSNLENAGVFNERLLGFLTGRVS